MAVSIPSCSKERGVEVAQSSVADAQRAAHPHHTFFVLDFLSEQYAVLAYGSSFFQLSEVDECRGLLAGKPTASGVGGIHLQSAVDKGNRKFLSPAALWFIASRNRAYAFCSSPALWLEQAEKNANIGSMTNSHANREDGCLDVIIVSLRCIYLAKI